MGVSPTLRPPLLPGKNPVPIVQEAGWVPGPVWMGGKSRPPRDSIPDRPARSQSLYRLSYPVHFMHFILLYIFPFRSSLCNLWRRDSRVTYEELIHIKHASVSRLPSQGDSLHHYSKPKFYFPPLLKQVTVYWWSFVMQDKETGQL